jgi:ankyrin repeat protein
MDDSRPRLSIALSEGDPLRVATLIAAGANIRYKRPGGYDALLDAVHGRDLARDPRLLDLLRLLIDNGVDLSGLSADRESGLRKLSWVGRFDAVRLLIDAGADKSQLAWTPLIEAVALGSLANVEEVLEGGPPLEETDWCSQTALLVALLAGSIPKARVLLEHGANPEARGGCGRPPLFYAVTGHHPDVLRWLLDNGADVDQMNDFGETALMKAAESSDLECLEVLLDAGANLEHDAN